MVNAEGEPTDSRPLQAATIIDQASPYRRHDVGAGPKLSNILHTSHLLEGIIQIEVAHEWNEVDVSVTWMLENIDKFHAPWIRSAIESGA